MAGGVLDANVAQTLLAAGNWVGLLDWLEAACAGGLVHADWPKLAAGIAASTAARWPAGAPATAGLSADHAQHLVAEMLSRLGVLPPWLAAALLHYKVPQSDILREQVFAWVEIFVAGRARAWPRCGGDHVRAHEERLFAALVQTFGPQTLFARCQDALTPARAAAVAERSATAAGVRGVLAPYARATVTVAAAPRPAPATPMEF